jgi:hypothetical protein
MNPTIDWRSALGLVLAAMLLSCEHPSKPVPAAKAKEQPFSDAVPRSRDADDAARFLAGMPGTPGSPFADLEKQEAWKVHRREMDRAWTKVEAKTLPAMRAFQQKELSGAAIERSTVFYPFSGPDSLMVTVFFPSSPTYVMVGLEPPGTLPVPKHFAKKDLGRNLARERDTIYSELHRSFFVTRQMDRQFRGQVTDGLFPPIVNLLVRSGHDILGYRYVRLDQDGRVVERHADSPAPGKFGDRGVEIEFRTNADQSTHKLLYFSVNLSDEKMRDNQPFLAFLKSLKGATSYFKATSYMTHHQDFSMIRDQTLALSTAILQDDSGIPYRFFLNGAWRVQLYGGYVRPYGSFRWLEQPDLRKAYSAADIKPLNFAIGYGFSRIRSNLLFAQRTGFK